MSTIARRFAASLSDPGAVVSVIVGVIVGALLGGATHDARPTARTDPSRRVESYEGDRRD